MRGFDPLNQRILSPGVGAVGRIGGERDVDLVGDGHRHHSRVGAERVDDVPDVAQPSRDVPRLPLGRVVANLDLDLESRSCIERDLALKRVDARLSV